MRILPNCCKVLLINFLLAGVMFNHSFALDSIPATLKTKVTAPTPDAVSWLLAEQSTGWILAEHNADQRIAPASLSKILTSYVVFEALENGTIELDDKVRVSEKAWKTGGSRMFIKVDSLVSIEELIQGLIIQSGNDAAVALAEYVAGDLTTFSELMNKTAARLGMTNSHFTNPSGLPDPEHYTTARDLMLLTTRLIADFPAYYQWYKVKEYTYNDITQNNRNRLLWQDDHVDGVKTGHTEEAGYCLVGSSVEQDMRLTAIVTGTDSDRSRTRAVESLLRYGFNYYEYLSVYKRGDGVTQLPVFKGEVNSVAASISADVSVLVPKGTANLLTAKITTKKHLIAPLSSNTEVGKLLLNYGEQTISEYPLLVNQTLDSGPIWSRWLDGAKLWWQE